MTYDLLIIFTNGEEKVVEGISEHGINDGTFFFYKNKRVSFITSNSIIFFGSFYDWVQ